MKLNLDLDLLKKLKEYIKEDEIQNGNNNLLNLILENLIDTKKSIAINVNIKRIPKSDVMLFVDIIANEENNKSRYNSNLLA
tara:strand:+ start:62 stop:307 length:246 start_codon:yes stop_codon:yes gene_type:complete